MKKFAKWSILVVFGLLLTAVSGCKEEKVAPAAAEDVEAAAAAVEEPATGPAVKHPAVEEVAADVPMDHPAH